ncbi:MAG TPA: helix-turn-helix transcriptional regulator [Candidatus Limicola stercorigallinarum]|nr:helix-turn-helix transcriptional regulator [Candidatus Limicola stercorigallinarum]
MARTASVLLHIPEPEGLPPAGEALPLLPPGLRLFACYVQAHRLYLEGEHQTSLGLVLGAFAMQEDSYPIPAIYLHLVAVMDLMARRRADEAREHLLAAWDLARPDGLIEPLAEHHGLLGGMLEAAIKPAWPDDFRRIIDITYRFSAGWRRVHNPATGDDVADNLTTTEFATCMLAARGWSNAEIAAHMGISVNRVKECISKSLKKLGVSSRKELGRFLLS